MYLRICRKGSIQESTVNSKISGGGEGRGRGEQSLLL